MVHVHDLYITVFYVPVVKSRKKATFNILCLHKYVCAGYVHLFANNEHALFSGLDLTTEFADHVSHHAEKLHVSQFLTDS